MVPSPTEPVRLRLVLAYRRTGKFAFHVLVGALETDPAMAAVDVVFAQGAGEMTAAIEDGRAAGVPVVVGWSFYSPDFGAMAALLAEVRGLADPPGALHVAGGVHASAEPEQTLRAGFDLVAVGEGEVLLRELLAAVGRGDDPRSLTGIASLQDDHLVLRGRGASIALDDYPPFAPKHARFGPIEITRGCVFACKFCQTPFFSKARFRHRSVDNVTDWVSFLYGRGFRDFRFLTPTSLSYGAEDEAGCPDAVEHLLRSVREVVGPTRKVFYGTFPSEVRPEHVTPATLRMLRGLVDNRTLILGGQSGSDRVLEHSRRGHGVADIERAAALCVEAGFTPHVDFLFGLPGETRDDVEATLALARRLVDAGARIHGHTFMPLPGTPFRGEAPGRVAADVRAELLRLASRGRLYGQWERQIAVAAELAGRRGG